MKFKGLGLALEIAAMAGVLGTVAPAYAGFPDRPIKLVVPFTAGGPTDALARNLAEGLRQQLNQTVVIENKAGAGANIGAEFVANSPADGYTLLFGTSGPLAINTSLFKKLSYDPVKSFDPVIMIGKMPNVFPFIHPCRSRTSRNSWPIQRPAKSSATRHREWAHPRIWPGSCLTRRPERICCTFLIVAPRKR